MVNQDLEKWAIEKEKELRGKVLSIAVDAEWIMLMVIRKAFNNNLKEVKEFYQTSNGQKKGISDFNFEEIIEVCKQGVIKYYPDVYDVNPLLFQSLDDLRKLRNKFAHHKIDTVGCKEDKTELAFHTIKNNSFLVAYTIYNINELERYIEFQDTNLEYSLAVLNTILSKEPTA